MLHNSADFLLPLLLITFQAVKIAVNTRFLIKDRLEGIGWFTYESLKRITRQHPEHQFYFLFDRPYVEEFIFSSNIIPITLFPPARHPFLWYWWFEYSVPRILSKLKPDAFLSPDGFLSLKASVKQTLVIHDLAFEHFSDHINRLTWRYYRYFTRRYAQKAFRIATVSEFSKQDIVNLYGIPSEKIDVVYNGSSEEFTPISEEEKKVVKKEYTAGNDYFIYVGALQPRKNIVNLLLAFDRFKTKNQGNVMLMIVGRDWAYSEVMKVHTSMQFKDQVLFYDHMNRSNLARLIGASLAMVYVSLFEGFGIPIVEAMNCDVPVLTSNTSSMSEVAGTAGLLADPCSVDDIASKMDLLYHSEQLRNDLIEKGKIQRSKFTWQQTADRLWESVMKSLNRTPSS